MVSGSYRGPARSGGGGSSRQPQGRQQDDGSRHEGQPGHGEGTRRQGDAPQTLVLTDGFSALFSVADKYGSSLHREL